MEITQDLVKSIFDYKDGFLYWKIKRSNMQIGDLAGYVDNKSGRRRIAINGKLYRSARLIFLYHKGFLPLKTDHIDRNISNELIDNLREATHSQNSKNRTSAKGSTSKYLGVSWNSRGNIWTAQIYTNGKNKHLGSFKNEDIAAMSYNIAASQIHGEFANLNKILTSA